MDKRLRTRSIVKLRSDPRRVGKVLKVNRSRSHAVVRFEGFPRPTLHAVEGLILVSTTDQLPLFEEEAGLV